MDAAGALNPKMLLLVLVIADVVEKILLPVLAIDKDVPPMPVPAADAWVLTALKGFKP